MQPYAEIDDITVYHGEPGADLDVDFSRGPDPEIYELDAAVDRLVKDYSQSELIYLAAPYSHQMPELEKVREETVTRVAARMMNAGVNVFSPLTHSCALIETGELDDEGWDFWKTIDLTYLESASALVVLAMHGWTTSTGVQAEIEHASDIGLPIIYTAPK